MIDPELKKEEKIVKRVIKQLLESKIDVKVSKSFVANLRSSLVEEKKEIIESKNMFNFSFIKPVAYFASGLALSAIIVVPMMSSNRAINSGDIMQSAVSVTKTEKYAFGEMTSMQNSARSGGGNAVSLMATPELAGGGGMGSADAPMMSKMIDPGFIYEPINYIYNYVGDELPEISDLATVYKRIEEHSNNSSIKDFRFNSKLVGIDKFDQTKVGNISFSEDREFGYNVNIDLRNNTFSINSNWERWPNPFKDCKDSACYDRNRLSKEDVISDEEAVRLADEFVKEYKIDVSDYGSGEISAVWRNNLLRAEERGSMYVPEETMVVYPLLVEDKEVFDQSGNKIGITVSVSNRYNKVRSAYNIKNNKYISSDYDTVNDIDELIGQAEEGGMAGNYKRDDAKKEVTVNLDTPEIKLIQYWKYDQDSNKTEKLLIPVLSFPIIDTDDDNRLYRNNIMVPLVEGVVDDSSPMPMPIRIME